MVSQYQHDSSYSPQVEWANVTFKPTADLKLRLGRIALRSAAAESLRDQAGRLAQAVARFRVGAVART